MPTSITSDRLPRPTPFLALDVATMRHNITAMQERAAAVGADLRPHVKTHKCLEIARLQVQAGARGITVATVSEAEAFAQAGFDDIFIAYPLWVDAARGERLARLAERAALRVGCDSVEAAAALGRHVARGSASGSAHGTAPGSAHGARLEVLVEVDSGMRRTGVPPQEAGAVAVALARAGLTPVGVFTFPGHSYAPTGREAAADDERRALGEAAESVAATGVCEGPLVVSGGSSPSVGFARPGGPVTELRPGVYVVQDAQQWALGSCGVDDIALTAYATVVSHAGGRIVLDAGTKVLGADRPAYASGNGRLLDHPQARIVSASEHHAVVELPAGEAPPPLGSVVRAVPNHACNAINLADELWVVGAGDGPQLAGAGVFEGSWRVAARNAND